METHRLATAIQQLRQELAPQLQVMEPQLVEIPRILTALQQLHQELAPQLDRRD